MREQKFLDQLSCKINEEKNLKWPIFIIANFVMGYHCVRPSILFYIHGPANLHVLEALKYHKITQIQNGR